MYRERLAGEGVEAGVLDGIDAEVLAAVDRATEEAKAAPVPDASSLDTQLWADGGSAWRS
jgi:TPP-dependent pyruvate/acetoin dehydrogenase alpha subunit